MKDDWKGEHLVRAKPSTAERAQEGRRVVSTTWHKQRRKTGEPTPAAAGHSRFTNRVFRSMAMDGA